MPWASDNSACETTQWSHHHNGALLHPHEFQESTVFIMTKFQYTRLWKGKIKKEKKGINFYWLYTLSYTSVLQISFTSTHSKKYIFHSDPVYTYVYVWIRNWSKKFLLWYIPSLMWHTDIFYLHVFKWFTTDAIDFMLNNHIEPFEKHCPMLRLFTCIY